MSEEKTIDSLYPMAYTNNRVSKLHIYTSTKENPFLAVGEIPIGTIFTVIGYGEIDGIRIQKIGFGEEDSPFFIRDDEFANGDAPEIIAEDIETNVDYSIKESYPTDDYYMGRINIPNAAAFYGPEDTLFYKVRGLGKGQKVWMNGVSLGGYEAIYLKSKNKDTMEFIGYVKTSQIDIPVSADVKEEPKEEPVVEQVMPIVTDTVIDETPVNKEIMRESAIVKDVKLNGSRIFDIATMVEGPDKEAAKSTYLSERLSENCVVIALHTDTPAKEKNVMRYIDTKLCIDSVFCEPGDAQGYSSLVSAGFTLLPTYTTYAFVVVREDDLVTLKKDMLRHGLKPHVFFKDFN